jgi:hypothetical protein
VKRRLFTILSAISLLLCVVVSVMWVRSYWVPEEYERFVHVPRQSLYHQQRVVSRRGVVWLCTTVLPEDFVRFAFAANADRIDGTWSHLRGVHPESLPQPENR